MKRIVLMVLTLFWKAPYYFFKIAKCAKNENRDKDEAFQLVKLVTTKANKAGRVTIVSHGLENIPKENGFIFFPNHQGLFDGLVFLESCPAPFTFVIKKEASNIILLKQVIAALRAIPIDRQDVRQSMKVIKEMAERVKQGDNFLIFPEGTRSKMQNKLLEFKGGTFKSAVMAKCPIVPCALIDSYKAFDDNSIKRISVHIYYLPPIYYDEYKDWKTPEIAAEVKSRIEAAIARHEQGQE